MIRRRPTIIGLLARLVGRFGAWLTSARTVSTPPEPWEPGMRDWIEATVEDIVRVWRGIRGGTR